MPIDSAHEIAIALEPARYTAKNRDVEVYLFVNAGTLDFDRDDLTGSKLRSMNLTQTRGGDWFIFEVFEDVFDLRVKLAFDDRPRLLGWKRRHFILKLCELLNVFDRE